MTKAMLKKKKPHAHSKVKHRKAHVIHNGLDLVHRLEHIKQSLGQISGSISDRATDVVSKSIKKARKQSKRVGHFVSSKPYRTVAIALVTFVTLGFIFRR
jgi:ElaB/YqjD/DUF883 family membrane-anchored ribosome-binding protein